MLSKNIKHLSKTRKVFANNLPTNLFVDHTSKIIGNNLFLQLKLNSDTLITPKPCMFSLAVDSSSSMNGACTHNSTTDLEASKYSRMDLVKYCTKLVLNCARDEDKIAIVQYSNDAWTTMKLTEMNHSSKINALDIVEKNFYPLTSTNLYAGLIKSLGELTQEKNYNTFNLMLTDGEPNVNPPRGIMHEFRNYMHKNNLDTSLNNFGYGYDLDSDLLSGLSHLGGGSFAHIPDHSMCGTVFINFLANCFATSIGKVKIRMKSSKNCKNIVALNNAPIEIIHPNGQKDNFIDIGGILSGQQRDILFCTSLDHLDYEIVLQLEFDGQTQEYVINGNNFNDKTQLQRYVDYNVDYNNSVMSMIDQDICYHMMKSSLLSIINDGLHKKNIVDSSNKLENYVRLLENIMSHTTDKKVLTNLMSLYKNTTGTASDDGQIMKAFSKDEWFQRWGTHYLKYFYSSLNRQLCTNFKDHALQIFGGKLFFEVRDEIEEIFSNMEVPNPSRVKNMNSHTNITSTAFQQSFNNASGPCICGDGLVTLANGEQKKVKDIIKGDVIKNRDGNIATVVCILKTKIHTGKAKMSTFNGMKVSPWHPIKLQQNDNWIFPTKVQPSVLVDVEYFYDFVLDKHHVVTVNDVDVICLGHNFTHDPVLIHPFFGTGKVINELKKDKHGWKQGLILIEHYKPIYKENSNKEELVDGFSLDHHKTL